MQPLAYPVQCAMLEQAWRSYVDTGHIDATIQQNLDPTILRSWQRCAPLLDARAAPRLTVLEGNALDRVLVAHAELLSVALPLIEDLHQFAEGSGIAVLLADGAACILEVLGDQPSVEVLHDQGARPGAYWDEGHTGTNALALALLEAMPVQVFGPEHYFKALHGFAGSAAPIHDVSGRTVGAVAMAGPTETCHPHTLAAVMAAARAIGNQLQTDIYLREANRHLTELRSVFGAISEGVISWNQNNRITHVNAHAGEILDLKPQAATGRSVDEVLELPAIIVRATDKGEILRDVEASIGVDGRSIDCIVSLKPIFEGLRGPVGYIVTLRPVERVRRLVHRIVGAQATLTLDDVQGDSAAIRRVRRQARIAARGTAPVLIEGEDGVGKDPLARAIHSQSERAEQPFIATNCLAIPHELMAGEFLGYEGGALNGAGSTGRPSRFELADGGALFLDEVESLSLEMQAALLQVIETGHVMRLGGARPIAVDVRIIAATSADLEQRAAEGSFLPKLFHRFGAFVIELPSLRDRLDDLPLLVERFLARITQRLDRAAFITDEALSVLHRYPWPGNIRELENVLERAVAGSHDGMIYVEDLPALVRSGRALPPGTLRPLPVLSIAEAEREAIDRAGWACEGRVTAMAEQLGVSRTTLWRRLKSMSIDPQVFRAR